MEELVCPFCEKQCKNNNSYAQHRIRCVKNPNRIDLSYMQNENFKVHLNNIGLKGRRIAIEKRNSTILIKTATCQNKKCGKTFSYEDKEEKSLKRFCCKSCSNSRLQTESLKQKISIGLKGIIYSKSCVCCNREIKTLYAGTKYCDSCNLNKARKKKYTIGKTKINKKMFICGTCQKELMKTDTLKNNSKNHFCNKDCFKIFAKLNNEYHKIQSKKISKGRKELFKKGEGIVYGGKTKWFNYNKDGHLIRIQGSYEYRTCLILDRLNYLNLIKDWEYTNNTIPYFDKDGISHSYLLDFKVYNLDGTFHYLEVKGFKKEIDKYKWDAVRNQGYQLDIWFEKEIKAMELKLDIKESEWGDELVKQGWKGRYKKNK